MCIENDLRSGQTVSSSIMTTLCVTHCFWYGNLCQIKILRCVLICLTQLNRHRATSGSSLKSVKMTMKAKHFELRQTPHRAIKTLVKEDFQNCFRKWQEQWDKCVRSVGGGYFEKVHGIVPFCVINFLFRPSPHFFIKPPMVAHEN